MDTDILYGIQETLAHPVLDTFFPYFTWLGEAGLVWIALGVALLCSRKWRFWGICILLSLACVGLFNELGIKHLVGRVRPYIAEGYDTLHFFAPTSFSFPSGHTGCSFAAATVLALSPAKPRWKILAWIVAATIAFSRLYLFVHYPTDVLAGAVLGMLYAIVVVKTALYLRKRKASPPDQGTHAAV